MTQAANAAPATREPAVADENQNDGATPPFDENMAVCVICQDNLRPGEPTTTMWCSHVFHSSCLTEWRVCARKDSEQCPFFCENSPAMAMDRFLEESCVAEVFLTWVLLSNECGLE